MLIDDGVTDTYIPKHRLDEEIEKKKAIKAQFDAVNTDLEGIKSKYKDDPTLTAKLNEMQEKNTKLDEKLKLQTIDGEIKLRAIKAGAKDETGSDILAFIKREGIKLNDDGTFEGIDAAFKDVQDKKSYLFGEVNKGGTGFIGKGKKTDGTPEAGELGKRLAEEQATALGSAVEARASFFK